MAKRSGLPREVGENVGEGFLEHPAAADVEARVVAGELHRPGNTDPIAEWCDAGLAAVVGDRTAWGFLGPAMVNGQGIALRRIDRQPQAELPAEQGALRTGGEHEGVAC